MFDLIDMLYCFGSFFHNNNNNNNNWGLILETGIPKSQWFDSLANSKNNRIFVGIFFAKLQSVAISQWSLGFFCTKQSVSQKAMKTTAAIKNGHTKFVN